MIQSGQTPHVYISLANWVRGAWSKELHRRLHHLLRRPRLHHCHQVLAPNCRCARIPSLDAARHLPECMDQDWQLHLKILLMSNWERQRYLKAEYHFSHPDLFLSIKPFFNESYLPIKDEVNVSGQSCTDKTHAKGEATFGDSADASDDACKARARADTSCRCFYAETTTTIWAWKVRHNEVWNLYFGIP